MSWQEELRRLDTELAGGKITQHQHRKLRDELLASASGGAAPSPVASPLARTDRPGWQSANPSTPPPAPEPPKPAKPSSAALLSTDKPTTAPSPADSRTTDSMEHPRLAEAPTVIRPAVRPPAPPPVPPPAPAPVPATPSTQPYPVDDPFPAMRANRTKPTWLFLSLGVLLVLALIIGGAWWYNSTRAGDPASSPQAQPPAPSAPADAPLEERLPALPGVQNPNNSTMSIARGRELGLYPQQYADAFARNGATEVIFRGSAVNGSSYLVLVVPTGSPANAKSVAEYLYRGTLASGFTKVDSDVTTATGSDTKTRVKATWYASGDKVVSVAFGQPLDQDKSTLASRQDEVVKAMRAVLPPG
ncbi:hypothetical protein [Amycolatopsis anabasis]|uniref:hypothetical protein n=1 Tax=Amycolatopsis anabasis TaxID=1840409 RepID=UPI00131B2EB0|nr:hypothetical protein [Amycolatopsis anabasis]